MRWSVVPSRWDMAGLVVLVLALAGMVVLFGPGRRIEYYSCHKCRNTKEVRAHTFFFGLGAWPDGEVVGAKYPVEEGHTHEWWRYGTWERMGLTPLLQAAGSAGSMYKDGWWPPSRAGDPAPATVTPPGTAEAP